MIAFIHNHMFYAQKWIKMLQYSMNAPVSEESYMRWTGRKGARSAGCWDPENLVKLEE